MVHGVDIVEIDRIEDLLRTHEQRFTTRVFTESECRYADSFPSGRAARYAARFAAKEAVFKALATGWSGGIRWQDVGVTHATGGQPKVSLTGHAAELASKLGISDWVISLSHSRGLAMASVIGRKDR